jgi:hypothetical protein
MMMFSWQFNIFILNCTAVIKQGFSYSRIVTRRVTLYPVFLICKKKKINQLKKAIKAERLTESLEMLEKSGIYGNLAIFIIQNHQNLEVA